MPVDTGTSTQLMTISGAVIGEGLPQMEKGDIVDVAVLSQELDYGEGTAPVILRRVCAARDEGCLDELRRTQGGKVSGVTVKGAGQRASYRRLSPPLANCDCALQKVGCSGEMAAVLR